MCTFLCFYPVIQKRAKNCSEGNVTLKITKLVLLHKHYCKPDIKSAFFYYCSVNHTKVFEVLFCVQMFTLYIVTSFLLRILSTWFFLAGKTSASCGGFVQRQELSRVLHHHQPSWGFLPPYCSLNVIQDSQASCFYLFLFWIRSAVFF